MRAIAITAFNRPHYLERMLRTLVANDLEAWEVFASVEPSPVVDDVCALLARHLPRARIDRNPQLLGPAVNPYKVLLAAFGAGSELVVYLEDDMVLACDVTRLAAWYGREVLPRRTMCLCLFSADHGGEADGHRLAYRKESFGTLGVVLTRAQWLAHFQPVWFHDVRGWDWSVRDFGLRPDPALYTLAPVVSRTNHIGREGGVHCTPEHHDATFSRTRVFPGPPPGRYEVLDPVE
jgi:hypothetical protein